MFAQIKDKNAIPLSAKEKSRATTEKNRQKGRKTPFLRIDIIIHRTKNLTNEIYGMGTTNPHDSVAQKTVRVSMLLQRKHRSTVDQCIHFPPQKL